MPSSVLPANAALSDGRHKIVAIIGGSFDPPTLAHIMVASQVVQLGCADEAWVVPCGNRPDKDTRVDAPTRLRMTEVAIQAALPDEFPVRCCDIEVSNGSFIPTVFLMRRLREAYPGITFRFVIGSDLPPTLPDWDHGDELIAENEFIVLPRPDSEPESEWPAGLKYTRVADCVTVHKPLLTTDISSTAARNRLHELGWLGAASIVPKEIFDKLRVVDVSLRPGTPRPDGSCRDETVFNQHLLVFVILSWKSTKAASPWEDISLIVILYSANAKLWRAANGGSTVLVLKQEP